MDASVTHRLGHRVQVDGEDGTLRVCRFCGHRWVTAHTDEELNARPCPALTGHCVALTLPDAEPAEPAPVRCTADPLCPRTAAAGAEVCWWHDVAVAPPPPVQAAKLRGSHGGFRPPGWR